MKAAALTLRAVPRLALRLPRRLRLALILAAVAAAALTGAYYGWLRDSSLVQVEDVTVTGLTGPDADRVRKRLTEAGLTMTTLHVREADLRSAVESEPSIRGLHATRDFPHGLRIAVIENRPIATIAIPDSGRVPIAGNGILMPGHSTKAAVPEIRVQGAQVGRHGTAAARMADDRAAPLVRVAGAAPAPLRQRATAIEHRKGEGIVVVMRDGPRVMFGDDSRAADKWRAAAGVLASKDAQGAAYVDVRLPDRPVAGGLEPQAAVPGVPGVSAAAAPDPAAAAPSTPTGGSPPAEPNAPAPAGTQASPAPAPAPSTSPQP